MMYKAAIKFIKLLKMTRTMSNIEAEAEEKKSEGLEDEAPLPVDGEEGLGLSSQPTMS